MTKKASIKDMEVRDVVTNMARFLKVDIEESTHEIRFEVPESLGSGYVKAISFDHGLGVIEANYLLTKEIAFTLDNEMVQPLKIIFNRESAITHKFSGTDKVHKIKHLECAILSCNNKHGHVLWMPADTPVSIFSLEINRKLFEQKISAYVSDMNEELEDLFRDLNGINLFYHKGHYSLEVTKFMDEFNHCELEGFMRAVYQEGKAYEILTHHLGQYLRDVGNPGGPVIERQSTVRLIEETVEIIKKEIETIGNIPGLARRVGLSPNTLQQGFNNIYKTSVNEFIRNYRINKAKELIETTEMNITEITYKVGINSRSYFSKIFKEQYGVTPKKYLTKYRKKGTKAISWFPPGIGKI